MMSGNATHTTILRGSVLALLGILCLQGLASAARVSLAALGERAGYDVDAAACTTVASGPTLAEGSRLDVRETVLSVRTDGNPFVAAWRARLAKTPSRLLDAYLARPAAREVDLGPILDAHGVPREFLYLALVESGMDARAVSPARAVGLWQFRSATAREYGLIVDDHLDERVDERRATFAASRYLRDLYHQFGTWELAAAAYNAGPGRVRRALNATGAASYWELIEAGHLPDETRAYVPKFLAVVELAAERTRALEVPATD